MTDPRLVPLRVTIRIGPLREPMPIRRRRQVYEVVVLAAAVHIKVPWQLKVPACLCAGGGTGWAHGDPGSRRGRTPTPGQAA